jgi:alpha-beta hydrolase superfamily lysophospholipase
VETDALGTQYETRTIALRPDAEGAVTATLLRRAADRPSDTAVLYLHGFVDYFFQTHVADFYTGRGSDFYALDLRKYGRSLAGHQTPNFCANLGEYYEEIDEAIRLIRSEDGHRRVLLTGHSTGGLIASLWAHDRHADGLVDAVVLNSAFFDFNEPWFTREVTGPITARVGRARPKAKLPFRLSPVYGQSIHSSARGDWEYNLAWKPLAGFPIYAGWLNAIRAGHLRVHRGLDLQAPVLSLASSASYKGKSWSERARAADSVLDVDQIVRWSTRLGPLVTIVRIDGGLHDLALSAGPARQRYFDEIDRWLSVYLG